MCCSKGSPILSIWLKCFWLYWVILFKDATTMQMLQRNVFKNNVSFQTHFMNQTSVFKNLFWKQCKLYHLKLHNGICQITERIFLQKQTFFRINYENFRQKLLRVWFGKSYSEFRIEQLQARWKTLKFLGNNFQCISVYWTELDMTLGCNVSYFVWLSKNWALLFTKPQSYIYC